MVVLLTGSFPLILELLRISMYPGLVVDILINQCLVLLGMRMPPQKHIIDSGLTSVTSTTQTLMEIAKGVINPDPFTNPTNCRAGSIIGQLTVQFDVVLDRTASGINDPSLLDWYIGYNINGGQTMPTADNVMGSAGADLLNQVFHQDGCILEFPTNTNVSDMQMHSWRLNVTLPKTWSKIMRGDTINLYFKFSFAIKTWVKIRVIYKEYFP